MDILYLLLPLSIVLVTLLVGLVIWAVYSGQFDDLNGPAYRILHDDDEDVGVHDVTGNQHEQQRKLSGKPVVRNL